MPPVPGSFTLSVRIAYADGETKDLKTNILIDPEGYVYEQTSRGELRIANAIVTLWQRKGDLWIMWPGSRFNQQNPQITDRTGQYAFLVPAAEYYLEVVVDNYESFVGTPFILEEVVPVHQDIELHYVGEAL